MFVAWKRVCRRIFFLGGTLRHHRLSLLCPLAAPL
uniref:Thioredoxin family protein n=1 Tax=Rhizophora mucronata TaxID=61149 RepID=A0A2P2NEI0_RHIMU